jgi:DNA repair protein RadC
MKSSELPISQPPRKFREPQEYKVIALRDCPLPENMHLCDTPEQAVEYWNIHVTKTPYFDPERECFVVLMLNTRRRVRGHQLVSIGTLDTVLVHPRDVFRVAVIANASALVLLHNHPSGETEPSQADIKITRDLIRAGQLMKIEILDHIVIGSDRHSSLRAQGYFY